MEQEELVSCCGICSTPARGCSEPMLLVRGAHVEQKWLGPLPSPCSVTGWRGGVEDDLGLDSQAGLAIS